MRRRASRPLRVTSDQFAFHRANANELRRAARRACLLSLAAWLRRILTGWR